VRELALKIVIADDHPLLARGVCEALEQVDDMDVVGVARSGSEVLSLVRQTHPDLVLLDVRMPGLDGLACLDRIRARHPEVKVVMFSASSSQDQIAAAFRRGASSYIVKSVNPVDLPSALRQAHDQTVFRPLIPDMDPIAGEDQPLDLTERELEILRAVARGMSNGDIAKELWVTEQTVKFHLTNIYRKLGVRNRTAATRVAHQHGLVESVVA
jgi:DNA-binding NarL/FixJ family response regulator